MCQMTKETMRMKRVQNTQKITQSRSPSKNRPFINFWKLTRTILEQLLFLLFPGNARGKKRPKASKHWSFLASRALAVKIIHWISKKSRICIETKVAVVRQRWHLIVSYISSKSQGTGALCTVRTAVAATTGILGTQRVQVMIHFSAFAIHKCDATVVSSSRSQKIIGNTAGTALRLDQRLGLVIISSRVTESGLSSISGIGNWSWVEHWTGHLRVEISGEVPVHWSHWIHQNIGHGEWTVCRLAALYFRLWLSRHWWRCASSLDSCKKGTEAVYF